jgi:hypothetical protein
MLRVKVFPFAKGGGQGRRVFFSSDCMRDWADGRVMDTEYGTISREKKPHQRKQPFEGAYIFIFSATKSILATNQIVVGKLIQGQKFSIHVQQDNHKLFSCRLKGSYSADTSRVSNTKLTTRTHLFFFADSRPRLALLLGGFILFSNCNDAFRHCPGLGKGNVPKQVQFNLT